jgi:hypothetical protein
MEMATISPFSAAPEHQDLTPLEGGRGFATVAASINLGKIRASLFWRDEGCLKGEVKTRPEVPTGRPHAARFLGREGHACLALVAPLLGYFFP